MIDLTGKTFVVLGVKGAGKSTLVDMIHNSYGELALYYDTLHEAPEITEYNVYQPQDKYSVPELESVIAAIIPQGKFAVPKFKVFTVDEGNRFFRPYPSPMPQKAKELNDICRHFGMSFGVIARRPSQLHSDLVDLADYLFIYRLTGKNDMVYLENTVSGLSDTVRKLGNHEFVQVNPDKSFEVCAPITPNKNWVKNAKILINR
jgi:hypothetical protein